MLIRAAMLIKEKYSLLIILSMVLGFFVGLFTSQIGVAMKGFSPIIIGFMIWSMSFMIQTPELIGALRDIKSNGFGLALNFVTAPLICLSVAYLLLQDSPDLMIGLILIGVTPCAGMALVWTGLLSGDISVSAVINASTMLLAPILIPWLMWLLVGSVVIINTQQIFTDLLLTLFIPLLLGLFCRAIAERTILLRIRTQREKQEKLSVFPAVSGIMAMYLMFMAINSSFATIIMFPLLAGIVLVSTAIIFPILFFLAWFITGPFFNKTTRIALTYASGMKNLPIAMAVAITSFATLTVFPIAIGFVIQSLTAVGFHKWLSRIEQRRV